MNFPLFFLPFFNPLLPPKKSRPSHACQLWRKSLQLELHHTSSKIPKAHPTISHNPNQQPRSTLPLLAISITHSNKFYIFYSSWMLIVTIPRYSSSCDKHNSATLAASGPRSLATIPAPIQLGYSPFVHHSTQETIAFINYNTASVYIDIKRPP